VLHARRCGWFSGQQLGMWMLEQARAAGVRFLSGRVTGVDTTGGRVHRRARRHGGGEESLATGALSTRPARLSTTSGACWVSNCRSFRSCTSSSRWKTAAA
jgi:hypothetical protein